jgi:hypothetical protein
MSSTIKVVCHGCGARYQVRKEKIRGHRFRATCKKCGGVIVARSSDAAESGGPSAVSLDRDDLFQEDECSWYAVITGKPHGPMSSIQLRRSYTSGSISKRTYIWRAGDPEWRRLAEVPEFADLFSEGQTSFYEPDPDPRQTGETKASGPSAFRRQGGGSPPGEPADDPTSFYQAQQEEEATHYHVGREQRPVMREEPWQPLPGGAANPAFGGQSPSLDQVPVIPPRKAILPSPTGVPQSPLPSAVKTQESIPRQASIPDHTRPLTSSEKAVAAKPPTVDLPPVTVTGPPGSTGQEPAPGFPVLTPTLGVRSVFEDKLKPVGSPAGPGHLLTPEAPPFWTTGKIAAAAAIGGGLAVALTVVVVVSLVRPKSPTVVVAGRSVQKAPAKKTQKAPPKVKPEGVKPKIENVQITVQNKSEDAVEKRPKAKAPGPEVKERKPSKKVSKRTARASRSKKRKRKRPRKRRQRARRSAGPDVDQLLGVSRKAAKKPDKDGADPDAILAAGKKAEEPDRDGADPDAILAAGSKRKSAPKRADPGLPRTLSKTQIRAVMRRAMPRVRGCYDKYRQAGLVQVRITVKPNGRADGTVVGKFAGTATGFCVLGGIHKAVFPKFSGAPITFTYPFKLE